ncbi:hypothetical protein BC939DRAFT_501167 [Gamsiella multidivaricata]|uniref:uncharacterized protein n=1 Tax=Gamsiella multidivaricata TaxID=101098 RepID=UPI00222112FB|nr:uncharacterized protein BC939DRAFT_501167 [Gamsiella multidivaricata]KAI7827633.1 hypothetical protein BC939DRAFT_501167 [Gamsiella multidivaricata]
MELRKDFHEGMLGMLEVLDKEMEVGVRALNATDQWTHSDHPGGSAEYSATMSGSLSRESRSCGPSWSIRQRRQRRVLCNHEWLVITRESLMRAVLEHQAEKKYALRLLPTSGPLLASFATHSGDHPGGSAEYSATMSGSLSRESRSCGPSWSIRQRRQRRVLCNHEWLVITRESLMRAVLEHQAEEPSSANEMRQECFTLAD